MFPTIPRQKVLDMVAGKASVDYPNTPYKECNALPTHPSFRAALPLCHLLYGDSTRLTHHFPGREAEYVDFVDGLSQGCPSGSPLAMLPLHLAVHITLSKHPTFVVRILAIVDNINLLGAIQVGSRRKRCPAQFGQDAMGSIPATPSTKHASCFPPSSMPASIEISIKLIVYLEQFGKSLSSTLS